MANKLKIINKNKHKGEQNDNHGYIRHCTTGKQLPDYNNNSNGTFDNQIYNMAITIKRR